MPRPAAVPDRIGADGSAARPQYKVGGFAGCMVLVAARPRASGMEIIVMARGQRKFSSEKAHPEVGLAVMFGRITTDPLISS